MSLADLVAFAGVPGLHPAIQIFTQTYRTLDNIKVHRQRCAEFASRCVSLILCLRENTKGMEGTKAIAIADEVGAIIERVNKKIQEWAGLNTLRSFLAQKEIMEGIDRFNRDIDAAMMKFSISMGLLTVSENQNQRAIYERDNAQLREVLQVIVKNQEDLKTLMGMPPQEADGVMRHLQEELHDPLLEPAEEKNFRRGLWVLHEGLKKLPPMTDLTGQVTRKSDYALFLGTYNDVYLGIWLDREQVALRLPRSLPHAPDAQKHFQREVTIWRNLKHPNIQPLYGTACIDGNVYSVSPWMDNGTAIAYVQKHPTADRLGILSEVAAGLEYLHLQNIVHGDLRGANVLISQDGVARLSDFGLSKVLEEVGQGMTSSTGINPRWFAPELIRQTGPVSTFSDVWSFSMLTLELMTGEQPYSYLSRDINVMRELDQGKTPGRPGPTATTVGLSDDLWSLMQKCWNKKPKSRPSMTTIRAKIAELRDPSLSVQGTNGRKAGSLLKRTGRRPSSANGVEPTSRWASKLFLKRSPSSSLIAEESIPDQYSQREHSMKLSNGSLRSHPPVGTDGDVLRLIVTQDSDTSDKQGSPTRYRPRLHEGLEVPDYSSTSLPNNFGTHFHRSPSIDDSLSPVMTISSEWGSLSSGSLLPAINDPEPIFHLNSHGYVTAGTLEGLVERLINNSNLTKDVEYRDMLLASCTDFSSPEDVFQIIIRRFHEENPDVHLGDRIAIRYNIMIVVKYWLSSPHLRVDPPLARQMKEFTLSVLSDQNGSETMKQKARDLLQSIETNDARQFSPSILLSPGRRIPKSSEILPRDLAIGLTLLEGDLYRQLQPADYIAHLEHHSGLNNLDTVSQTNNRICLWVKKSVLYSNVLEQRADALKFFVNTAQECFKMRNFASLSAIVAALNSAPLARLRLTRDELPPPTTRILEDLNDLLDPSFRHRTYHTALNSLANPAGKDACIPWIAVHLADLYSVFHRYPKVIEINGRPLINFERYLKFTARIKDVLQYKAPDLEQYRQQGQLAYLQHCLRNVQLNASVEDNLMEISLRYEMEETSVHDSRLRELGRLGFRVKQP